MLLKEITKKKLKRLKECWKKFKQLLELLMTELVTLLRPLSKQKVVNKLLEELKKMQNELKKLPTTTRQKNWKENPKKEELLPRIRQKPNLLNILLKILFHFEKQRSLKKLLSRKLNELLKKLLMLESQLRKPQNEQLKPKRKALELMLKLKLIWQKLKADLDKPKEQFGGLKENCTKPRNTNQLLKEELQSKSPTLRRNFQTKFNKIIFILII